MIDLQDASPDSVDYTALAKMWSPKQWLSRVGTRRQRQEWHREPDDGPRGLVCGVPCDEASGEVEVTP